MRKMLKQKPNIVLVGLIYDSNLGDTAIYESTLHMINEIIDKKIVEIRNIDLYGRVGPEDGLCNAVQKEMHRVKRLVTRTSISEQYIYELKKRCQEKIDYDTIALIFVGGGLIKYNHQIISTPMTEVLNYADRYHIPVMLSAVGVEGYSNDNQSCQELKKALNLPCVKVITTRDDIQTLQKQYIVSNIHTSLVADPACALNQLYEKNNQEEKLIGLNVCRGNLFKDYEKDMSEDELMDFWIGIYKIAYKNGYKCGIMTNGLKADHMFAKKVYNQLNDKNVILFNRPHNVKELVEQITKCQAIIATRLHATIVSYSYCIPCVSLVWNNKQLFFGKNIGREGFFVQENEISPAKIWNKIISQMITPLGCDSKYISSTQNEINMFIKQYAIKKEIKWD